MGATGWSYFVSYQQDINQALQKLKDEIFKQGQYEKPFEINEEEIEHQLAYLASIYQTLPPGMREQSEKSLALAKAAIKLPKPKRKIPKTIKQLLKQCGTEGTHSILDIERISSTPTLGTIVPLSRQQLVDIFGTDQPTHDMIAKWSTRIDSPDAEPLYKRWEGLYIIVYKDSRPNEIYFEGCSGD